MNDRFEIVSEQRIEKNFLYNIYILRDKQTGVLYVGCLHGGLTPLIDKDGKPLTYTAGI
ncbi:MAG: DUF6440 family protein [Oscillospiraceae bacterium]|nr:DUF6440 family protein [Oscillospiraceae bacterium]